MNRTLLRAFAIVALTASLLAGAFFIPEISSGVGMPAINIPEQSRSKPASNKMQSSLGEMADLMRTKGRPAAADFAARHKLALSDDRVTVVVETLGAPAAAADISALGGIVETSYQNLVQASVPIDRLEELASSSKVSFIREPQRPTQFVTSEGVSDIGASSWHAGGNKGAGVKIAVVDAGFWGYGARRSEGELPSNVITKSFRSDGDINGGGEAHGTACAEIVYDVAPGAQLYLVNFGTEVELGNAIDYLAGQGVKVISASWGALGNFRGDGQGIINDIVRRANEAGILWTNAAGNMGQNHWSGNFTDANGNGLTEFSGADERNSFYAQSGQWIDIYLTWDKWPATDQDYDLYLFKSSQPNKPVAVSNGWQSGTQSPAEEIHYLVPVTQSGTYYVTIYKQSAAGDARFHLYTYPIQPNYRVTEGSMGGQPTDSPYAMSVGAVPVGGTMLEEYSSRGPTTDGRIKPDIVGPDRVSTATYGSGGFAGTSASAPHIAGAGALVKAANPGYTPGMVQSALEAKAIDLGSPGKDNLYGSGKLNLASNPDDKTAPTVSNVRPSGTIYTNFTNVGANYSDSGSGINTASVVVTLDGQKLTGCTAGATEVNCSVTDLGQGTHTIGGSVWDNSGNTAPISGSFNVSSSPPSPSPNPSVVDWLLSLLFRR